MLKWILVILAILIGLILLVVVIGLLLPKAHSASRTIKLRQPPEKVWDTITNTQDMPSWRGNVRNIESLGQRDGKPAFREIWSNGGLSYVIETIDPPRRYVTRIIDESAFGGTWTFDLVPDAEGTQLAITEDGEIYNPIFRFVSHFILGYHATIDQYAAALARKFGQDLQLQ